MNTLISPHRDGKLIANVIKLFGIHTIYGSSNRNPLRAISTIVRKAKKGESIVITPDGPRGPVYEINSNIIRLASKTQLPIITSSYTTSRYKTFRTWDKFILPLPFSKISFHFGSPINVKQNPEKDEILQYDNRLKSQLDEINK